MYTVLGLVAILFWSTSVAFSRSLAEALGPVTAAAAVFLTSGALGCAWLAVTRPGFRIVAALPRRYLFGCGALFVLYGVCLYMAIGFSAHRAQVLAVGIINYLWPGLTLVLSIPLLGKKAKATLLPGAAMAFAGVVLAMGQGGLRSLLPGPGAPRASFAPYVLALGAALAWALYSNLARRWGREGGAVPIFLLATGLVLGAMRLGVTEHSHWGPQPVLELAFLAVVPGLLAYAFWDAAMRKGEVILVASFSHLTPVLSTVVSWAYLGVRPGWELWAACALVIAGAVVCRYSVQER